MATVAYIMMALSPHMPMVCLGPSELGVIRLLVPVSDSVIVYSMDWKKVLFIFKLHPYPFNQFTGGKYFFDP